MADHKALEFADERPEAEVPLDSSISTSSSASASRLPSRRATHLSWDVFICRFPADAETVSDVPADWEPPPLGSASEVRRRMTEALPGLRFGADGWATYDGPGFSIETRVDPGEDVDVTGMTLFIRGGGSAGAAAVAVTRALGGRAVSASDGRFLDDAGMAEDAFMEWREYRDRTAGRSAEEYEIEHTGSEDLFVSDGELGTWAGGFRVDDAMLLLARWGGGEESNPYIGGSRVPEPARIRILADLDEEVARLGRVIADPSLPPRGLEIITDHPQAARTFEDCLERNSVPGRVVVRQ